MAKRIYIQLSRSITPEEWEKVYQESLYMAKKFPLGRLCTKHFLGTESLCLVPVREEFFPGGRYPGQGWQTDGDLKYGATAECYYTPRDLGLEPGEEGHDPMLDVFDGCMEDGLPKKKGIEIWGDNTCYEPYADYLLAIAFMIEHRLGNKAFIYGYSPSEEALPAVNLANKILKHKITLPDSFDLERLIIRAAKTGLSPLTQLRIILQFYYGCQLPGT